MGQTDQRVEPTVVDRRSRGWWWIGNDTIDDYAGKVGCTAWTVYCYLCRMAGGDRECHPAVDTICGALNLSAPTVTKALRRLTSAVLVRVVPRTDAAGRSLSNSYHILEPVLVGGKKAPAATPAAVVEAEGEGKDIYPQGQSSLPPAPQDSLPSKDLTGKEELLTQLGPLEAALAALAEGGNPNAVVGRLFTARFGATYPPNYGRLGRIARGLSGGHVRLCQAIWACPAVGGDPHDYLQRAVARDAAKRGPGPPGGHGNDDDDPQMAALRRLREARP